MIASLGEIERSLAAALRLAWRDERAMASFNLSVEGFWGSFLAAALVAPIALLFFFSEFRLWTEIQPAIALPARPVFLAIEFAAFLIDWAAFLVLMIFLTRQFGLAGRYVPFAIAWNWSSVISALLVAPPVALYALGLLGAEAALVINLIALVFVILYQQRVAEVALGLPPLQALGVPLIDVFLGLFADTVTGAVHTYVAGG